MKIVKEQVISSYEDGGKFSEAMKRQTLEIAGVTYTYHRTGTCRNVFLSPCGEWVAKVPIIATRTAGIGSGIDIYQSEGKEYGLPIEFLHNILEYQAYIECPEIFKPHLAETKILGDGAIMQRFVEVTQVSYGNSLGRCKTTGLTQVFDFDIFFSAALFERHEAGFRYYNAVIKNDGFPENIREWAYDCYKLASIRR